MSGKQRDEKESGPVEENTAAETSAEQSGQPEQKQPRPETEQAQRPARKPAPEPAKARAPTTGQTRRGIAPAPSQTDTPEPSPEQAPPAEQEPFPAEVAETTAELEVRFAGITAVGLVREHNEDNLVNANLTDGKLHPRNETCVDTIEERGAIFAVCDGMGGAAAGEVASQMGVDILYDYLRSGEEFPTRDDLARRLMAAVEHAGKRIYETAQADTSRRGMGTTVTAAVLMDKVLFVAQVGDSRAYLLRRGELKQITKDQSLVTQLIEAGHLTEAEAEAFEHSNIILQALGTTETVQVDLTFIELRKRDRLMLCSDGLSGMVESERLRQTLLEIADPKACCGNLIEQANAGGGHDNITVTVVDFQGTSLDEPASEHTFGYVQYPLPPLAMTDEDSTDETAVRTDEEVTEELPLELPTPKSSSHLWLVAGVLALVAAGATVVVTGTGSDPEQPEATDTHEVQPAQAEDEPGETQAQQDEVEPSGEREPAPESVPVRVRGDVENAELVINGEVKGALSTVGWQVIDLVPGAYRFEARSRGSTTAVVVATIRPDTPTEIVLALPSGATAPDVPKRPPEQTTPGPATDKQPRTAGQSQAQPESDMPPATAKITPAKRTVRKKPPRKRRPAPTKPAEASPSEPPAAPPTEPPAEPPTEPAPPELEEKRPEPTPAKPSDKVLPDNPY